MATYLARVSASIELISTEPSGEGGFVKIELAGIELNTRNYIVAAHLARRRLCAALELAMDAGDGSYGGRNA